MLDNRKFNPAVSKSSKTKPVFDDIKKSFNYMQTNFSGVYVFSFEAESSATEITIN